MAQSLRTIQAAMNAAGWSVAQMNAFFDINPTVLQNYLSGVTANVNTSTALVDAIVSGGSANTDILGNALQVELGESEMVGANNIWFVEGHFACTTNGTAGLKVQLTAYDGLVLNTTTSQVAFVMNVNGASNGVGVVAPGTAFGATVNALSVDFTAMIQITSGYGRLGIQFSQNVSTAVNTNIGPYGYIRAESLLA